MPEKVPPRLLGGRYELDGMLGRGGMAEVYRARDIRLDRVLAVKILRDDLARDQTFQARFRRETHSAASLNHPSIVAVYDTGEDASGPSHVPYIVMEYVDGRTLRDVLRDDRRLSPERALEIIDGVLQALDYSHRNGIVHRGIKPGNVMITRTGDVKVMDFGIARALSEASASTALTEQMLEATQYLSPEQARGERVDASSDLYSTGCLLYELLTRRPPFLGDSPVAIAYQHVRENPVPPSRLNPLMPGWADAIVLKAMAKNPAERYHSAADMRTDIKRGVEGALVASASPRAWSRSPAAQSDVQPTILRRPIITRISEEASRREEPLGDEVISFNNAQSSSTAVETIRLTRTVRASTTFDLSKTRSLSGGAGVTFLDIAKAQASVQSELARRYSLQAGTELTLEQSTVVNVPAYTNVQVILHWKLVWVTGRVTLAERGAEVAELPFEVTVGLAFDKETRDLNHRAL